MSEKLPLGKDFSRIWSASLITNLVDGVLKLSAPLLAVSLTENPVLIGLLSAMSLLPWLFFAIPIGAMVDRIDKRKALVLGNFGRSALAITVAFSITQEFMNIWILLGCVFLFGVCEVLVDTTSQSVLPQILDKSNFERGNSRLQISEVIVAQFAGSPLSGFLYAVAIALPFYFSSTGFFIAAVLLVIFPFHKDVNPVHEDDQGKERLGMLGDIKFALNYLYNDKRVLGIVAITTSIGFFYSLSTSIAPLFILKELDVAPSYFGVTLAIQGVGALLGSVVAPIASQKFGRGKALALNLAVASLMLLLTGLAPNAIVFVIISVVIGFSISIWNILLMSLYQSLIPPHLFGRIHGARRTLVWGLMPIGSLIGGVIATWGLRLPFLIGGAISLAISLYFRKLILQIAQESVDAPRA